MKISIIGLGQVGSVSAACLASLGHAIIGVDIDDAKVRAIGSGRSTFAEPRLDGLLGDAVATGRLLATADADDAVQATDMTLMCIGTPSGPRGDVDLRQVITASRAIGDALRRKNGRHIIVVRSTVLPGTVRGEVVPIIEAASGKRHGSDFGMAAVPEFLRAGSAVDDFFNPSQIVVGVDDEETAAQVVPLFRVLDGPLSVGSIETAEMVKYVANVWHGLKVVFANEMGALCHAMAIDGREVMDVFAGDTKLNLSRAYLRPGFAFGGPCLRKDTQALADRAQTLSLDLPLTSSIIPSNDRLIERAADRVLASGKRQVSLLGLSFKAETGDLRGSPYVALALRLIECGIDLRVFDPHVDFSELAPSGSGGMRRMFDGRVDSLDQALAHAAIIVLGTSHRAFADVRAKLKPAHLVIDLDG